jgi:two-component system, chemotaxis family, response regulator Rcp1
MSSMHENTLDLEDHRRTIMDLQVHCLQAIGHRTLAEIGAALASDAGRSTAGAAMTLRRPVVLWVEDNPNDVLLLRQALTEARIEVDLIVSENAVLAFQYMMEREPYASAPRPPDLILIDLNLPVMRGTVVLIELRQHLPWRNAPMVVLSSTANPKELQECMGLGASECITKPGNLDGYAMIVDRLRRYLPRIPSSPSQPPLSRN